MDEEKDFSAGLIGQVASSLAETEPRLSFTTGELLDRLGEVADWIDANGSSKHQTPWLIHRDVVREASRRIALESGRGNSVGRETEHQPERQSMPSVVAPEIDYAALAYQIRLDRERGGGE